MPIRWVARDPRDGWKAGPWDLEDDRYEWRHEGSPCLIVRGPILRRLRALVEFPDGAPAGAELTDHVALRVLDLKAVLVDIVDPGFVLGIAGEVLDRGVDVKVGAANIRGVAMHRQFA
jgi:hypothetical protein